MGNVKSYTDAQLLERVESIGGTIPNQGKYLIIGVQSQEDEYDAFDDKFYVFDGNVFKMVSSGTTNTGATGLKLFKEKFNLPGAAVWKTNEFYFDLYAKGMHKGKMKALIQQKPVHYYRDSDGDDKAEEQGQLYFEVRGFNMHGVDYDPFSEKVGFKIGGWSLGCQVWNRMGDYRNMIKATWERNKPVDYALLKEW